MQEIREPMGLLKMDHIRAMLSMKRIQRAWIAKYQQAPTVDDVERIYDIFEKQLLSGLVEYTDPKYGCLECVQWLREQGIRIGSTTAIRMP